MAREYNLNSKKGRMMLEDPIPKLIMRMAVPTIIAQLITVIYNLTDTYFVSNLGTNAVAAIGVNSSLETVINLAANLLAVGTASYISRLLGAQEKKKADNVLSTSVFTGILISLVVMGAGLLTIGGLVDLLGATVECREYSIQYATYVLLAAPFMITSFILNQTLRGEGSATFAMVGIGFGGILNCVLDPIFIRTLNLGVAGASMATAISKLVSCAILLWPYIRKHTNVAMSFRNIKYRKKDMFEVVSISSTSFFRILLQLVSSIVMNNVAGTFSTSVLAGVSLGNKVMRFPFAIIMGFSQGYQPVVGFNWGAKRYDRVRESFKFSCIVSVIGCAVIGAVLAVFARPAVHLFNKDDLELIDIGVMFIRFECITMMIHAFVTTVNMFYGGIGRAGEALLLSTARQGYCLIPLLFIIPHFAGAIGLAYCQPAADAITLFIGLPLAFNAMKITRKQEKLENASAPKSE